MSKKLFSMMLVLVLALAVLPAALAETVSSWRLAASKFGLFQSGHARSGLVIGTQTIEIHRFACCSARCGGDRQ